MKVKSIMYKGNEFDTAALEEPAPGSSIASRDTPGVVPWHGSAENDATREHPALSRDDVEPSAPPAATGRRDAATVDSASAATPGTHPPHQAALPRRSFMLGDIVAAIHHAGTVARRIYARHTQRGEARAVYNVLSELDDRTLRDLGFDRSEIRSVAAELTGEAEQTRVRILRTIAQSSERDPRKGL